MWKRRSFDRGRRSGRRDVLVFRLGGREKGRLERLEEEEERLFVG